VGHDLRPHCTLLAPAEGLLLLAFNSFSSSFENPIGSISYQTPQHLLSCSLFFVPLSFQGWHSAAFPLGQWCALLSHSFLCTVCDSPPPCVGRKLCGVGCRVFALCLKRELGLQGPGDLTSTREQPAVFSCWQQLSFPSAGSTGVYLLSFIAVPCVRAYFWIWGQQKEAPARTLSKVALASRHCCGDYS